MRLTIASAWSRMRPREKPAYTLVSASRLPGTDPRESRTNRELCIRNAPLPSPDLSQILRTTIRVQHAPIATVAGCEFASA